uniref:NR LBD domain-containing protein n=1 Tax=Strongyloides stercoralis TaxID=6248 RepID=A0A0K0DTV2_STRER
MSNRNTPNKNQPSDQPHDQPIKTGNLSDVPGQLGPSGFTTQPLPQQTTQGRTSRQSTVPSPTKKAKTPVVKKTRSKTRKRLPKGGSEKSTLRQNTSILTAELPSTVIPINKGINGSKEITTVILHMENEPIVDVSKVDTSEDLMRYVNAEMNFHQLINMVLYMAQILQISKKKIRDDEYNCIRQLIAAFEFKPKTAGDRHAITIARLCLAFPG